LGPGEGRASVSDESAEGFVEHLDRSVRWDASLRLGDGDGRTIQNVDARLAYVVRRSLPEISRAFGAPAEGKLDVDGDRRKIEGYGWLVHRWTRVPPLIWARAFCLEWDSVDLSSASGGPLGDAVGAAGGARFAFWQRRAGSGAPSVTSAALGAGGKVWSFAGIRSLASSRTALRPPALEARLINGEVRLWCRVEPEIERAFQFAQLEPPGKIRWCTVCLAASGEIVIEEPQGRLQGRVRGRLWRPTAILRSRSGWFTESGMPEPDPRIPVRL
jgi:hypothetical protein